MKNKTHYEARLNRNISRTYYTKTIYKKGTLIASFSESEFKKFTLKNIDNHFHPQITLGHGASEYFDVEKDIDFVKVTTIINIREGIVKLKK